MESTIATNPFHAPHKYEHAKRDFLWASGRALIFIVFAVMWMMQSSPLSWLLRPLATLMVVESLLFIAVNASDAYLSMAREKHKRLYKTWYGMHLAFVCIAVGGIIASWNFGTVPSIWQLLVDYPQLSAPLAYFLLTLYLWPKLRRTYPSEVPQNRTEEAEVGTHRTTKSATIPAS